MLIAGAGAANAGSAPASSVTTVTVNTADQTTSTTVTLAPGQTATVTATGLADVCGGVCPGDADGSFNPAFGGVGPAGGDFLFIGSSGSLTNTGSAPAAIILAAQDGTDYSDNSGSYTVTITVAPTCDKPGNGNGDTNHVHCGAPGQLKKTA
jgi:hypothetical protein